MADLSTSVVVSQAPRRSVKRSAKVRGRLTSVDGGHCGTLDAALRRVSTVISQSSHGQWAIRTPATRRIANIELSAEWLSASLSLRQLSRPISLKIIGETLCRNARINGSERIVGQCRPGGRQIVVDIPVELVPWDSDENLDTLLGRAIAGLDDTVSKTRAGGAPPVQVATPREQIEACFEEAGWPVQAGEGDSLEVPLEVPGSYFVGSVNHDSDLTRLRVPILPAEYGAASLDCRDAVSVLLWLTAGRIRMVRPLRSRRSLALEATLLPGHSNAIGLAHACAALSVVLQRSAAEAALLLADEALARIYLSNLGFPTSA